MQRSMTSEERAELEASAKETGSAFWSQSLWTFAFLSGMMIAVLYAGWSLVSWLLRSTLNVTWTTSVDPWVLPVVAFGSVGFAVISFARVFQRIRKLHTRLRSDIEGGVVVESR
ncbi:MAG: hypothetical protein OEW68_14525 [Gammaproteobacteria bacterium]|nr:hypothetical protein [Gammaproteobacteria bacterium]MDH4316046.1 hypothetical protein [Gammaproteobacteria bacterium]MDH5213928.1 hypothetical protein [Gammaproteobacteria bacterium]